MPRAEFLKRWTTTLASYLSCCCGNVCQATIFAHSLLAACVVAIRSVSLYPLFTLSDTEEIQLRAWQKNLVLPWVLTLGVLGVFSCAKQCLRCLRCPRCFNCKRKAIAERPKTHEKTSTGPPRGPPMIPPRGGPRGRPRSLPPRYPTTHTLSKRGKR